ncbi:MAG: hypothetical protein JWM84_3151 [Nocardioides sp.]|nr:hypothetical protein [Nocardioides sp.]
MKRPKEPASLDEVHTALEQLLTRAEGLLEAAWAGQPYDPSLVEAHLMAYRDKWLPAALRAAGLEEAPQPFGHPGRRPICEQCGSRMDVPNREQGGGRTKRFCSSRCRTAAHRATRT